MTETMVRVTDVAPISHREGMALAGTEYQRFSDALGRLQPGDWSKRTVCTGWDVKQLVAHVFGFAESNASFRVFASGMINGRRRAAQKGYDHFIHGMNEVQVEQRTHLTPVQLVSRWSPPSDNRSCSQPASLCHEHPLLRRQLRRPTRPGRGQP